MAAQGVSVVYDPVTLLPETDLEVAAGTCTVLRGANGSGKTTLLRVLAGTLTPTTGEATVDGRTSDERDPVIRRQVAALLGAPATFRDLTLAEHLVLVDSTWGGNPQTCLERIESALEQLEIAHLAERFPHELSSGQTQLFRLSVTLFRPCQVLLLDEPEQRLDTHRRQVVIDLVKARRDAGLTVVMACHDPQMTQAVADDVLDLREHDR